MSCFSESLMMLQKVQWALHVLLRFHVLGAQCFRDDGVDACDACEVGRVVVQDRTENRPRFASSGETVLDGELDIRKDQSEKVLDGVERLLPPVAPVQVDAQARVPNHARLRGASLSFPQNTDVCRQARVCGRRNSTDGFRRRGPSRWTFPSVPGSGPSRCMTHDSL